MKPRNYGFDDAAQYDEWTEELMKNIPESWGSSEGSAESIILEYLRALEARLRENGPGCSCIFERHWDPEALQRISGFEISAEHHRDGFQLRIIHADCHWSSVLDDLADLAELVQRAAQHAEVCK